MNRYIVLSLAAALLLVTRVYGNDNLTPAEYFSSPGLGVKARITLADGKLFHGALVERSSHPWVEISSDQVFPAPDGKGLRSGGRSTIWIQVTQVSTIKIGTQSPPEGKAPWTETKPEPNGANKTREDMRPGG